MLGKQLCSIVKNKSVSFLLDNPEFQSVEVYKGGILVTIGYDNKRDAIISEDWSDKDLNPIFFMQVIFEHEEMFFE